MLDLDKNKKYVLAVSGGSDSMAMLHMALISKLDIVVCHVNYKKRATSDRDEDIVRSFCSIHDIPFRVKIAETEHKGNFQQQARKVRYAFFGETLKTFHADALLTAHHKDDVLETALLRKLQGREVGYYGIRQDVVVHGMKIHRPLLNYWKKDLVEYCRENGVAFGEDESNLLDQYARNRIRHYVIQPKSQEEKEHMLRSFEQENIKLSESYDSCIQVLRELEFPDRMPLNTLHLCDQPALLLRLWLIGLNEKAHHLTKRQIDQILQLQLHNEGSKELSLFTSYVITKEYDVLHFGIRTEVNDYQYILPRIMEMQTPWFKTQLKGSLKDGLTVQENEFPLTIRNVQPGDRLRYSYGHKKVHRFLIDSKIPAASRKGWPVVCNCHNEVIFVCGMGSNPEHFTNTPNLFVVK